MSASLERRHVIVRGRVQGVGFRAFVEARAVALGLAGWVRNRKDGTVEAVFDGPPMWLLRCLRPAGTGRAALR